MSQWEENMEYLEAYDDAALDTIEDDAEAINKQLDILDRDRMARENGEKPVGEWRRTDFKDILHRYPKLRHLRTCELWALFLESTGTINEVFYAKRWSMEDARRECQNGRCPWFDVATWTIESRMEESSDYGFQQLDTLLVAEEEKLVKIWHRL